MDVRVRVASAADLAAILSIYAQPDLDDGNVLDLEQARAQLDRIHAHPDYHLYVAEVGGEIVGTFALLIMPNISHRGSPAGIVDQVGVAPAHRSKGIGKAMMEHARAVCAQAGCYKMMLSSNVKRDRAHAFYDSLGFTRHGYSFYVKP